MYLKCCCLSFDNVQNINCSLLSWTDVAVDSAELSRLTQNSIHFLNDAVIVMHLYFHVSLMELHDAQTDKYLLI